MKTDTIKVEGMSCGHCELAVQEAIFRLPGVKKAKANKGKSQATVKYDESQVILDKIIEAVNAVGYKAAVGA